MLMGMRRPNRPRHPLNDETNYTTWILGGIAALAVIFGLFFMFKNSVEHLKLLLRQTDLPEENGTSACE